MWHEPALLDPQMNHPSMQSASAIELALERSVPAGLDSRPQRARTLQQCLSGIADDEAARDKAPARSRKK
jgi:hypothetical protein